MKTETKVGEYIINRDGSKVQYCATYGVTYASMTLTQARRAVNAGLNFFAALDRMFNTPVFGHQMIASMVGEVGQPCTEWLGCDSIGGPWSHDKLRVRVGCTQMTREDLTKLKEMLS